MNKFRMGLDDVCRLTQFISDRIFAVIFGLGVCAIFISVYLAEGSLREATTNLGDTLIVIAVTLPISLYFAERTTVNVLDEIQAMRGAGIEAIFESRMQSAGQFRAAVDAAVLRSGRLMLMAVALRHMFDVRNEYTRQICMRMADPQLELRVMVLDPDCCDAKLRAHVEGTDQMREDIKSTLTWGVPAVLQKRIKCSIGANPKLRAQLIAAIAERRSDAASTWPNPLIEEIRSACRMEIRTMTVQPMAFLILTDKSLFTEQYLNGRPLELDPGKCIGKHLPVIQFHSGGRVARFYEAYYEHCWHSAIDRTVDAIVTALNRLEGSFLLSLVPSEPVQPEAGSRKAA